MQYAPLRINEREFIIAMKLSNHCLHAKDVPEDIRQLAEQFSRYAATEYLSDGPRPYVKGLSNEKKLEVFSHVFPQEGAVVQMSYTSKELAAASSPAILLWHASCRLMNAVEAVTGVNPEPNQLYRHLIPNHPKWEGVSKVSRAAVSGT